MPGKAFVPTPTIPHLSLFEDVHNVIAGTTEYGDRVLVTYCRQNACGAVFHARLSTWACYSPIRLATFLAMLDHQRIELPPNDRATWTRAVAGGLEAVPGDAEKH